MSLTQQIKAANTKNVAIETENARQAQEIVELNKSIETLETGAATAAESIDKLTAENVALVSEKTEMESVHTEAITAKDTEIAEGAERESKLQAAIDNPANVDASMIPAQQEIKMADAQADADEATSGTETRTLTEQYESITDNRERMAFWRANEAALIKESEENK